MTELMIKIPVGSKWRHKNGKVYTVKIIANEQSVREDYPVTIVYYDKEGNIWSKAKKRFLETMERI